MAVGSSGRIVIEIDSELKQQLHAALQQEGRTLKDWFLEHAHKFLYDSTQTAFDFSGMSGSHAAHEIRASYSPKSAKGESP